MRVKYLKKRYFIVSLSLYLFIAYWLLVFIFSFICVSIEARLLCDGFFNELADKEYLIEATLIPLVIFIVGVALESMIQIYKKFTALDE